MHPIIAFCVWQLLIYTLFMVGCHELDEKDDTFTDLGEEPYDQHTSD